MNFQIYSHRYGYEIIKNNKEAQAPFYDFCSMLSNISDNDVITMFQAEKKKGNNAKSVSIVINKLIKERLKEIGWREECPIFKNGEINSNTSDWRLDFVYPNLFSVEVAFNHGSATTVNLLKPVLASELNHVEKEFQTKFGIIVTATKRLKNEGGFDNAIGTFEGYVLQTKPLMNQLTIPLIIIGLEPFETFEIKHKKEGNRQIGYIMIKETGQIISVL